MKSSTKKMTGLRDVVITAARARRAKSTSYNNKVNESSASGVGASGVPFLFLSAYAQQDVVPARLATISRLDKLVRCLDAMWERC